MAGTPNGWIKLERCERDPFKLVGQGIAAIVKVAQQSEDRRQALAAGQWLVQYGESLWRERHAAKAINAAPPVLSDRQVILAELKGLYAKALGDSTLIVEAEPDERSQHDSNR